MKTRSITLYALLSVILFVGQVAFAGLPNIQLVSLFIIVYTLVFKWQALIIVYLFVLFEGLLFGFGIWWFSYLYSYPLLVVLTILFAKLLKENRLLWALLAALFGMSFGTLSAIPYLFISGPEFTLAYIISGLYFDALHAASNFVATLLLLKPLKSLITKLYTKFMSFGSTA